MIRPSLALATLAQPVLFGAANDPGELAPVRLVLLMASSERSAHLRALRRVAGLFQGGRTLENLVGAQSIDDPQRVHVEGVRGEDPPLGAAERIARCC